MRTLTLTLTLNPEDGRFALMTGDALKEWLRCAIIDGSRELDSGELDVEVIADAYEPTVPR